MSEGISRSGKLYIDNIDAGYFMPIDIGDLVWEDLEGNGLQDGGEPGRNGVDVELSTTDGHTIRGWLLNGGSERTVH